MSYSFLIKTSRFFSSQIIVYMPEDFGIVSEGITAPLKTVTETNIEFSVAEPGIQTTAVTLKLK